MDEAALNYNEYANVDDGTCIAYVEGCMDEAYIEFLPNQMFMFMYACVLVCVYVRCLLPEDPMGRGQTVS